MSSSVIPFRGLPPRPSFLAVPANLPDMNDAAQQGVSAGFAVLHYKGRNWSISYRGENTMIADGRGAPVPSLDVIVVGVSPTISKQFYLKTFTEGDNAAPDCFSENGTHPDPASPTPQHAVCATCPMNVFGSKLHANGSKAKACQDSRRIAVVPLGDPANETYGGPMLLRLPPMTLGNFASYGRDLARYGAQPPQIATTIGFDYSVAYPRMVFTPAGWLPDQATSETAMNWVTDDYTARVLSFSAADVDEGAGEAPAPAASPLATPRPSFVAPAQQGQAPAPAPATPVAPAPATPVAPAGNVSAFTSPAPAKRTPRPAATAPKPAPDPAPAATPAPVFDERAVMQKMMEEMQAKLNAMGGATQTAAVVQAQPPMPTSLAESAEDDNVVVPATQVVKTTQDVEDLVANLLGPAA